MELILYHFDSCPYCIVVRDVIDELNVPIREYRDTQKDPKHRQELLRLNGKTQVPCLLINGRPMLESKDIIEFLRKNFTPRR